MPWINASERYPFSDWHICRKIGTTVRMPLMFTSNVIAGVDGKTYKKEEIEWFYTREPSFTLQDVINAFTNGVISGNKQMMKNAWYETATDYFKRVYSIDINEQNNGKE